MPSLIDRGPPTPLSSLYVHVPVCRDRCTYCAFATISDDTALHGPLVDGLLGEHARWGGTHSWDTVYIGGGTPGLLAPKQLLRLLSGLVSGSARAPDEITLEVNPANISQDSLLAWRDLGITRLSVGVQTFDDHALQGLARRHDGGEAERALETVANTWTGTWSADLLVGWSGTNLAGLTNDLARLLRHSPPHISIYGLELEPGTALHKRTQTGRDLPLSVDEMSACADLWASHLKAAGLERYEISNFAKAGHESRHNLRYWANEEYLGLGPGACSSSGDLRWANRRDALRWLTDLRDERSCRQSAEIIRPHARLLESLAVGLRVSAGIQRAELDRRFSPVWLDVLLAQVDDLASVGLCLEAHHLRLIEPERDRLDAMLKLIARDWPSDSGRSW